MKILTDDDIAQVPIAVLSDAIRDHLEADAAGNAIAPPRLSAAFPNGKLVFTAGGNEQLAGFRAYETFTSGARNAEDQLVAVWDTNSCALKGVCLGTQLGALRTGVLGGIAVDLLAPPEARSCAIIGSGLQAETQLLGVLAHRGLTDVRVYSRTWAHAQAFAGLFDDVVPHETVEAAVDGADIVILATNATEPVVDAQLLAQTQHVTTMGPKLRGAHELPLNFIKDGVCLFSDSPQQIDAQGKAHMLAEHPRRADIQHLGDLIPRSELHKGQTLFLSAGLAGTEVVALNAAIDYLSGLGAE